MIKIDIENYIESQLLELNENDEHLDLYKAFQHPKLKVIYSTLHSKLTGSFKSMNKRLPSGTGAYFWAEDSRELLSSIEMIDSLKVVLSQSQFAFNLDPYYQDILDKCKTFLSQRQGSNIPPGMKKVNIYYTIPIFNPIDTVTVHQGEINKIFDLKFIAEGSYAQVFKYNDDFYQRFFIVKRAKKDLNIKELARFRREYEEMKKLSSPYIVEVLKFDEVNNEYYMEYMDTTLRDYIQKNNGNLTYAKRQNIGRQVLSAFEYIHSKELLHRDISPNNVLLKLYEDTIVVKISDFGLVRIPNSELTTVNTEFKGSFNDPSLRTEGFDNYNVTHETYALTMLMLYIMTGSTKADKIKDDKIRMFVNKGLSSDKSKRFQSVHELADGFRHMLEKNV